VLGKSQIFVKSPFGLAPASKGAQRAKSAPDKGKLVNFGRKGEKFERKREKIGRKNP
jgi:hypothetical protein